MSDENKPYWQLETRAIHAGRIPEDGTNAVTTAIHPSTTYRVGYPGDEGVVEAGDLAGA